MKKVTRYDLDTGKCHDDGAGDCAAELTQQTQGDWVEWGDYKDLLDAWNDLNKELQDTLYNAPEF